MSKIPRAGLLMKLWLLKQGSVSFKIAKKRGVRELDVSHSIQLRKSAAGTERKKMEMPVFWAQLTSPLIAFDYLCV